MSDRPSIFEVAKKANCSIATVSNVLNNKGRVSKEKRENILRIVSSLGYQVDSAGRNLRTRRSEIFGLLFYPSCAEIFRNPFYAEVMEGLEERLTKSGYHLLLVGYEASTVTSPIPNFLQSGKVDGIIMLGRFPTDIVRGFYKIHTPMLLLDTNVEWPIDSVVSDGFSAGVQTVRHLAAKGHTRILMMGYVWEDSNIDLRVNGFLEGLKECGLPADENSVLRSHLYNHDLYEELKKRLAGPNPPTALVACNDTMAATMIDRLKADGFKLPEQLSIVGYDDEEFARNTEPSLTTIRVNKKELGRVGADLILKRTRAPQTPVTKLRLPVELVERDSVQAARAKIAPQKRFLRNQTPQHSSNSGLSDHI